MIIIAALFGMANASSLEDGFVNPLEETKPWCYWYWLDSDITKEGITKDIEAMAKVGIKRAMIGNIRDKRLNTGSVKMFSEQWYDLTRHAFEEANRLSVELLMFNAPGWSQSGGPWIKPEQSMRRVTWNEFSSKGGKFSRKVRPDGIAASQDIAVLAVPKRDAVSIEGTPSSTTRQSKGNGVLQFKHTRPFTARALVVYGKAKGKLYALQNGQRELIAEINANGGSSRTDFLPDGIETFSFGEVTAAEFELESNANCKVVLTSAPKVAQVIEKQMGRMHPTPSPTWKSYIFPDSVEPKDMSTVIKQKDIIDLTGKLKANGVVTCKLPKGNWDVIYFGMVTTGKKNSPAPPEATGLECDKMSKLHVRHHFNSMFGELMAKMTPAQKAAFKGITIDSYEVGAQNWTDGFAKEFAKRNGYNPITLLPVMTGRVIDSAKTSDQFLWDLRRSVADMITEYYVGGMRDIAHEHDLTLWSENYGHWGFPGDFLSYGGHSDEIGGEFWTRIKNRGPIECRAASSAAHIYGKRRVYAEAFTSGLKLKDHPYVFKARGEELFCDGINHFVLHVYAHQPRDGVPGKNPGFGTAFHRNTPWFTQSRDWVKYLQRCHHMLQQGNPSADVAVYIGDFAPQMTGPANPVAAGYDYDYIGSDAILRNLDIVDGRWVVFDEHDSSRIAASYELLAMPKVKYIRPKVLKRLDELKAKGGKVTNSVPVTAKALQDAGIDPVVSDTTCNIRWKLRLLDDGKMFFLSNFAKAGTFEATLRVSGMAPELFNPVTGEITKLARYKADKNGTRITIDVKDKSNSCFIVFRDKTSQPSVVKAQQGGKDIAPAKLTLFYNDNNTLIAETATAGTYDLTMSDGEIRSLTVKRSSDTIAINGSWKTTKTFQQGFSVQQETTFSVPSEFGKDQRVYLDLGKVEVMAKVTLNGKAYDTLWMPPFRLDVTDVLKPGENKLQVLVTSTSEGQPKLGKPVRLNTATQKSVKD